MRFKDNDSTVCDGNMGTKEEQKVRLESNIKSAKARLKGYKLDKKALKRMYNKGYSYNRNTLQEIIGNCYVEIDKAKGDIEEYSEKLLKLKK